jgi:hypothetical protein
VCKVARGHDDIFRLASCLNGGKLREQWESDLFIYCGVAVLNVARVRTEAQPLEYLQWLEKSAPTRQPAAECDANCASKDDWLVFHGFFPESFISATHPTV